MNRLPVLRALLPSLNQVKNGFSKNNLAVAPQARSAIFSSSLISTGRPFSSSSTVGQGRSQGENNKFTRGQGHRNVNEVKVDSSEEFGTSRDDHGFRNSPRSRIVEENLKRQSEKAATSRKAFRKRIAPGQDEKVSRTLAATDPDQDQLQHERIRQDQGAEEVDPADQFGTLTMGAGEIPVRGEQAKFYKKELDELESRIYSIDTVEEDDETRITPGNREDRMNMRKLRITVKILLRDRKLTEALDLFTHSIKNGGFRYDLKDAQWLYRILMAECSRVGNVKMTFRLFHDMKERGCEVTPNIYTSLFNSIAMSVGDRQENLHRLDIARRNMVDKGFELNFFHYHVIIKALGRLEQIQQAFALVDEMIERSSAPDSSENLFPTTETFCFLFQACISDKENGFRHSLMTWKKMISLGIRPNHFIFRLFLRSVRECGVVLPKSVRKQLGESSMGSETEARYINPAAPPSPEDKYLTVRYEDEIHDSELKLLPPLLVEPGLENNCVCILTDLGERPDEEERENKDDLVKKYQYNHHSLVVPYRSESESKESELISLLRNSKTPSRNVKTILMFQENRLAILGGMKTIVSEMERFRVKPDLIIVTELVQIIHPLDIPDLMHVIQTDRVKLDTDFFNLMIKKYIKWNEMRDARKVLKLMHKFRVHPNIMTWGIFSVGCKSWKAGKGILRDMDDYKMEPNIQIMGGLLAGAISTFQPHYVLRVMEEVKLRNLQPDALFVSNVIDFRTKLQKGIVDWEKGVEVQPASLKKQIEENNEEFQHYFTKFKLRYETWIGSIPEKILAQANNPELFKNDDPWLDDYVARRESLKKKQEFS